MKRSRISISREALEALENYEWPGNVRELENAIERAVVLCRRPQIDVDDLPESLHGTSALTGARKTASELGMEDFETNPMPLAIALETPERRIIESALKRNNWNRQATAAELDINRTTLYKKMVKYRLNVGEMITG
jgi:DNA-binding NtrC family response regulator